MKNIEILDCTFRDGAHINKGMFGKDRAIRVLNGLEQARVDSVELGFIEPLSAKPNTTYFSSIKEAQDFFSLKNKNYKIKKGLMIRTDRCDLRVIKPNKYIDFIRIALYPEHLSEVIKYSNKLIGYGYKVYLNLIAITSYQIEDINKLLLKLSKLIDFSGLSIVDTYGALTEQRLLDIIPLFEKILDDDQELGIHLHENLNSCSMLYKVFIKNTLKKKLIIDCSLAGMGRVPGNFPTEVCANLMNNDFKKNYLVNELAQIASNEIQSFQDLNKWGYMPIYATSAMLNIDRSYPEYFQKEGLSDQENIEAQKIIKKKYLVKKFSIQRANTAIKIIHD